MSNRESALYDKEKEQVSYDPHQGELFQSPEDNAKFPHGIFVYHCLPLEFLEEELKTGTFGNHERSKYKETYVSTKEHAAVMEAFSVRPAINYHLDDDQNSAFRDFIVLKAKIDARNLNWDIEDYAFQTIHGTIYNWVLKNHESIPFKSIESAKIFRVDRHGNRTELQTIANFREFAKKS